MMFDSVSKLSMEYDVAAVTGVLKLRKKLGRLLFHLGHCPSKNKNNNKNKLSF